MSRRLSSGLGSVLPALRAVAHRLNRRRHLHLLWFTRRLPYPRSSTARRPCRRSCIRRLRSWRQRLPRHRHHLSPLFRRRVRRILRVVPRPVRGRHLLSRSLARAVPTTATARRPAMPVPRRFIGDSPVTVPNSTPMVTASPVSGSRDSGRLSVSRTQWGSQTDDSAWDPRILL